MDGWTDWLTSEPRNFAKRSFSSRRRHRRRDIDMLFTDTRFPFLVSFSLFSLVFLFCWKSFSAMPRHVAGMKSQQAQRRSLSSTFLARRRDFPRQLVGLWELDALLPLLLIRRRKKKHRYADQTKFCRPLIKYVIAGFLRLTRLSFSAFFFQGEIISRDRDRRTRRESSSSTFLVKFAEHERYWTIKLELIVSLKSEVSRRYVLCTV